MLSYDESSKESFERWCIYVSKFEGNLPLDFILGFYVTQVGAGMEKSGFLLYKRSCDYVLTVGQDLFMIYHN